MIDYSRLHAFALELAADAGDYALAELMAQKDISRKGDGIDVVTAVDVEAERRIIARIQQEFPEHGITGEEHGCVCNPSSAIQWLIDPLDGTNNYVMAFPLFGNCITVLEAGEPVVAAFRNSMLRSTASAYAGGGAWVDGVKAEIGTFPDLPRTTVSWTQGYVVPTDDAFANDSLYKLEQVFKRALRTWSPSIDWGLISTGHVGAFVAFKNEPHDLVGGELLVRELGGDVWRDASGDLVIAGASEVVARILEVLDL